MPTSTRGCQFNEKCSELKTVKDDRNKLAHGESSFEEIGRELTIQQLQVMIDAAYSFFKSMVDKITDYLDNREYNINN